MRYIGRIITTTKPEGISEFIDVTNDTSTIINKETKIPTLIIGYKNAVNICGELRITEKKIGKNLYWTFSKRERRIDYEPDLANFISYVSKFLMEFCDYEYLDFITADDEKKKEFSSVMSNNHRKIVYVTKTMYYVYYPNKNKTYGISKDVLNYIGFDNDKIFKRLSSPQNTIVSDTDFLDTKITKSKFVQPLLYYLGTF